MTGQSISAVIAESVPGVLLLVFQFGSDHVGHRVESLLGHLVGLRQDLRLYGKVLAREVDH